MERSSHVSSVFYAYSRSDCSVKMMLSRFLNEQNSPKHLIPILDMPIS